MDGLERRGVNQREAWRLGGFVVPNKDQVQGGQDAKGNLNQRDDIAVFGVALRFVHGRHLFHNRLVEVRQPAPHRRLGRSLPFKPAFEIL